MAGKRLRKSISSSPTGNGGFLNRPPLSIQASGTSTISPSSNNLDATLQSRVTALEMSLALMLTLLSQLFNLMSPASIVDQKSPASTAHDRSPTLSLDGNPEDFIDSDDHEEGSIPKYARRVKERVGEQTPLRDYHSSEKPRSGKVIGGMPRKGADLTMTMISVEKVEKATKAERVEKDFKVETVEKAKKAERVEKHDKAVKVETVDKADKVEIPKEPVKIEKDEKALKDNKAAKPGESLTFTCCLRILSSRYKCSKLVAIHTVPGFVEAG
ncbi:hypothetical protein CRG98_017104 [Punica granatum]|uniref:Uncharacterized protein n=1 Tax=Punica granatum TaxID=22663 RepID=A0A2I0K2W4_PUNGR|nr:hypothetical protein CRG98_017104 [Punica granatum]